MKKSNSEILNKVKNVINEKSKLKNNSDYEKKEEVSPLDHKINKWIDKNAETIVKELIQEEIKNIFKK